VKNEMKNCTDCKHADWKKTAAGKLHPSGDGKCKMAFVYTLPPLPASMYWHTTNEPKPCGGFINRRSDLKDHCTYYNRA